MGGFVESSLACLFMIMNTATMFASGVMIAFGMTFNMPSGSGWNMSLQTVGVFMGAIGGLIMLVSVIGFMGTCGTSSCLTRMYSWLLILTIVMQFSFGVFTIIESNNREHNLAFTWDRLANHERISIEQVRRCCGFKSVLERPDCAYTKEAPCGEQIVNIQKTYLMTLGLLIVAVAAVELVLYGVSSYLASAYTRRRAEQIAMEEARKERRNSRTAPGVVPRKSSV